MTYEVLNEQILEAGIVGAGGAGFPTHFKLVPNMDCMIVNGAECEPLLYTDYQLLEHYGRNIVDTLSDVLALCQIKEGIIAIKKKHSELISILRDYTQRYPHIIVQEIDNIYPIGDEVTLIYECTGRVVPRGELPSSQNVVVCNVETLLNLSNKLSKNTNVTHTYLTLGGNIENPRVLRVPIGTRVRDLFKLIALKISEEDTILIGGPMMGYFGGLETIITKTTKAILILPKDHILHRLKETADVKVVKRAMSACSQCRMCTDLCPRNRLGHKVEPHKVMNAFANGLLNHYKGIETALGCCGCNLCSYFSCHHDLSPASLMQAVKKELLAHGERGPKDLEPIPKDSKSPKVPSSRLISRIGLSQYDKKAHLDEMELVPNLVYIPMRQHIGKPAIPVVTVGEIIQVGQLIGREHLEGISTNVHASIDGEVIDIRDGLIIIERTER